MIIVLASVAMLAGVALVAGIALGILGRRQPVSDFDLTDAVDRELPQTQCGQCGYAGCRPYAEAVVLSGEAINLCPPGGRATVRRLAELLSRDVLPPATPAPATRVVASIDEERCIGCLHCRNACPVDAIIGAQQLLHTVIESECTGCELCIAPCPVDCISLRALA